MANELQAYTTSGLTAYAILLNTIGQIWNGSTFVSYNGANWTSYDIALTEAGAGIYLGNMPAAAAGAYSYVVYSQAGASPATTDTLKGNGYIQWDGVAELTLSTIESQTDDIGVAGAGLTAIPTIANVTTVASVTNQVTANVTSISGDSTAADNLEAMLDGTGGVTLTTAITGNITGNLSGSVGSLATQAKADVNSEVVDALNTDTYAEPGQGAPAATASLAAKIGYLYKSWRNKKTQTTTTRSIYNDAGDTVDQKATDSDDGSTYTKGELGTGP